MEQSTFKLRGNWKHFIIKTTVTYCISLNLRHNNSIYYKRNECVSDFWHHRRTKRCLFCFCLFVCLYSTFIYINNKHKHILWWFHMVFSQHIIFYYRISSCNLPEAKMLHTPWSCTGWQKPLVPSRASRLWNCHNRERHGEVSLPHTRDHQGHWC